MGEKTSYVGLTGKQIDTLKTQGCCAEAWNRVKVKASFNCDQVVNCVFIGDVQIGDLSGNTRTIYGVEKKAGIFNATIANCSIGDNVRISNVGVHIGNYDIEAGVCIEDVGTIQTNKGAMFGNGVDVELINEGGGREVKIFNELSSQFAYVISVHRYRPQVISKLNAIAEKYTEVIRSDRGRIGHNACICSTKKIIDVNVGPYGVINGACSLVNGTILSSADAPTIVGDEVIADDFIICESSSVTGGAILGKVFIGQGCQVGKQYSAENCVFFANCEAFHGEGCNVFAGPYSVTHHKSTLLIAGLFSFYNAGSGTNQSNHLYKLGPVHEGKLERGTKTGSFSYMMWPCRCGPFSVILGKHTATFDTSIHPFSLIQAGPNGATYMVPGQNLTTVGTVRDGAKWPSRDRRKGPVKRDKICFEVLSPYTVGKMIQGDCELKQLQETTDKSIEEVSVGGAKVRRPILRTGRKFYSNGIEMYLLEKVFEKAEKADMTGGIKQAFQDSEGSVYSEQWVDIGGLLMPKQRLDDLHKAIEKGAITTIEDFNTAIDKIYEAYEADEWTWVKHVYKERFGINVENMTADELVKAGESYLAAKSKFLRLVLADAEKEFGELSQTGFGQDGCAEDIAKDFEEVRGTYDGSKFVKQMKDVIEELQKRLIAFKVKIQ
ncbi:MAG: DUF4954 family protein [Planctomycetota bacterium]